jgi:phage gpG-like protein
MLNFEIMIDFKKYDITKARELAKKHGANVTQQMIQNIHSMDLVQKGNLLKSIKSSVRSTKGEVDRIQFAYEWYGKFHEIGVDNAFGKGVKIKKQPWRSMAINQELPQISEDFADYYAQLIIEEIQVDSTKMEM